MSNESNTRRRWRRWIRSIRQHTETLVIDDSYFRLAMASAQRAKIPANNAAYQWVMRQYWQVSLLGVRRLCDKNPRTYSLYVLLDQIEQAPTALSRNSFVGLYRESPLPKGTGSEHFDNLAGKGEIHIPASFATSDKAVLDAMRQRFKVIQDQFIAHNDRRPKYLPRHKWQEIHDAIAELENLAYRWDMLLNATAAGPLREEVAKFHEADFRAMWTERPSETTH